MNCVRKKKDAEEYEKRKRERKREKDVYLVLGALCLFQLV